MVKAIFFKIQNYSDKPPQVIQSFNHLKIVMTSSNKKLQSFIQLGLFLGIIIVVNIFANFFYGHLDLTEDKRFSLTKPTKNLVKDITSDGGRVFIQIYLEGEFPAGFKRLQNSVKDLMAEFRSISNNIDYEFIDPNKGSVDEINAMREKLKEMGIMPTNLRIKSGTENRELLIFPAAVINYNNRSMPVNLLEANQAGINQEVVLNNSISLLEYKFSNAIQKIQTIYRPKIVFTQGHGELNSAETADLEKTMYQYYDFTKINLDSIVNLSNDIDLLIVAKPRSRFTEKHKFLIDQYVMGGGKVMWLIDQLAVSIDSMQGNAAFVPSNYDLNLDDLLFKYGARINSNLVLDLESSKIPQIIGMQGDQPQIELFDWWYHPAITPKTDHPIVKGLDRINLRFANTVDTVRTRNPIKKTVLLSSSQNSRLQFSPMRLNFEILRYEPDATKFNKPFQPLAVLLEGKFPSHYKGRVAPAMMDMLSQLNIKFLEESKPTAKMLVIGDGDIAKNPVNRRTGEYMPLGFNEYMRYQFANKDFILNAIEYMLDERGVMEARGKDVKLRLLNRVKAQEEKTQWQLINIVVPLVFVVIFGFLFTYLRRRRYS